MKLHHAAIIALTVAAVHAAYAALALRAINDMLHG